MYSITRKFLVIDWYTILVTQSISLLTETFPKIIFCFSDYLAALHFSIYKGDGIFMKKLASFNSHFEHQHKLVLYRESIKQCCSVQRLLLQCLLLVRACAFKIDGDVLFPRSPLVLWAPGPDYSLSWQLGIILYRFIVSYYFFSLFGSFLLAGSMHHILFTTQLYQI